MLEKTSLRPETILALADACAAVAAALRAYAERADADDTSSSATTMSAPAAPAKPARTPTPSKPAGQPPSLKEILSAHRWQTPKPPTINGTTKKPQPPAKPTPPKTSAPPKAPETPKTPAPAPTKLPEAVGKPSYAFGTQPAGPEPGQRVGPK